MQVKSRVRNRKIEYTKRHGCSLLGTQWKYKESAIHSAELKEADVYIRSYKDVESI
jgi:hypothetical protein